MVDTGISPSDHAPLVQLDVNFLMQKVASGDTLLELDDDEKSLDELLKSDELDA